MIRHHHWTFAALTILICVGSGASAASLSYDLVIRNGRVLDGAGSPWVRADIAIKEGRIAKIGWVRERGVREIDALERYVSPGFIDMMDQSGAILLKSGAAENKLKMGVTTVIAGEGGTPVAAADIPAYFERLESRGIGVNFGTYYQAEQARSVAMGDGDGVPTSRQLDIMRAEVAKAMRAGVFGISTALIYAPSSFQLTPELIELAKVAGRCNGFYATHMRDESADLLEALREAIRIGAESGTKVEIFHLKAAFAPGWGKLMPDAVAEIEAARARGVDIAADLYPYTAGGTGLSVTIPNWIFAQGYAKGFERLKDPELRARAKRDLAAGSQPGWSNLVQASGGWDHIMLVNAADPKSARFEGRNIADIAHELHRDPVDVAWDLAARAFPNRATALFFMMSEADIETALKQRWTSIGSDAGAAEKFGSVDTLGLPHPRSYGTFPRIIAEYVKKRSVLSLEDAIRKMTSWPATRMGLADRGVIRVGLWADLTIFDLERIKDASTWEKPTAAPEGIDYVIVNGKVAIDNGRRTSVNPGRVLRHECEAP